MNSDSKKNTRKNNRKICKEETQFYVNADIINAQTLDMSETGVRIETKDPIMVHMKIGNDADSEISFAKLVWAKRQDDGSVAYGLEFSDDTDDNIF
jgi:hypothetical protein